MQYKLAHILACAPAVRGLTLTFDHDHLSTNSAILSEFTHTVSFETDNNFDVTARSLLSQAVTRLLSDIPETDSPTTETFGTAELVHPELAGLSIADEFNSITTDIEYYKSLISSYSTEQVENESRYSNFLTADDGEKSAYISMYSSDAAYYLSYHSQYLSLYTAYTATSGKTVSSSGSQTSANSASSLSSSASGTSSSSAEASSAETSRSSGTSSASGAISSAASSSSTTSSTGAAAAVGYSGSCLLSLGLVYALI